MSENETKTIKLNIPFEECMDFLAKNYPDKMTAWITKLIEEGLRK